MREKGSYSDFLAGMVVFGIFAFCMILALLAGAGAYKRLTARDAACYDARICGQYIGTKVRSAEGPDSLSVDPDGRILSVRETLDGEDYLSYIYLDKGWICEFFSSADYEPGFTEGERLLEAQDLRFCLEDGLFTARITTAAGKEVTTVISLQNRERGDVR